MLKWKVGGEIKGKGREEGEIERMLMLAILLLLYGTTVQTQHDKIWVMSA